MPDESEVAAAMRQAAADHVNGRLTAAETIYRQVLQRFPDHGGALHGLGTIAFQTGHARSAVELLERALRQRPDAVESLNALGLALRQAGRLAESVDRHRRATELRPLDAGGFANLSLALRDLGRLDDAEAACRRAIALAPLDPLPHNNLGTVLMRAGRFDEAEAALRAALRVKPDYLKAINNLGTTRLWSGRPAEAVAEYDRALRLAPDHAELHWHRAIALLTIGDWQRGWIEYEWRWRCAEYRSLRYALNAPAWDGSDPAGRTILLTPEQGLGDSIQFVRYVPLLAERGARVLVLCQPPLAGLFKNLAGAERVITADATASVQEGAALSLPPPLRDVPFDMHLPLLSLPLRFGTTPATVPARAPYLFADSDQREKWRQKLEARALQKARRAGSSVPDIERRIGLSWAGRPIPDPLRTCGLAALAPLAAVAGVRFISLQIGPPAAEAQSPPAGMEVEDYSDELTDFTETAALMANLDLVITIDSAVAHLAGALGRPTWTLLRRAADWRWLTDREDNPWYPTMRLFRQSHAGDWGAVVGRVTDELRNIG